MKKIISLAIALSLCLLVFCGCSRSDDGAPYGMKLVSAPEINKYYSLYVPEGWTTDMTTGITSAYVSAVDRSNISVTYEVPKESSIAEYWDNRVKQFDSIFDDFEIVEAGVNTKLGQADAARYTYKATYNGSEYQFMQLFAVQGVYLFTFTYTALNEENNLGKIPFDSNLETVYKIIENFRFE